MCMFLRDEGVATPADETKAELHFGQFCRFLMEIQKYKLTHKTRSIKGKFQSIPPSKRFDVAARWGYPVIVTLQQIFFQAALDLW
mmetsp:Transcript_4792/g.13976  ORF Transcript_4792/g.13976 Transcript_4792/m.13976 type:complete len:85 (-) Transcript_4792:172-426(-)